MRREREKAKREGIGMILEGVGRFCKIMAKNTFKLLWFLYSQDFKPKFSFFSAIIASLEYIFTIFGRKNSRKGYKKEFLIFLNIFYHLADKILIVFKMVRKLLRIKNRVTTPSMFFVFNFFILRSIRKLNI